MKIFTHRETDRVFVSPRGISRWEDELRILRSLKWVTSLVVELRETVSHILFKRKSLLAALSIWKQLPPQVVHGPYFRIVTHSAPFIVMRYNRSDPTPNHQKFQWEGEKVTKLTFLMGTYELCYESSTSFMHYPSFWTWLWCLNYSRSHACRECLAIFLASSLTQEPAALLQSFEHSQSPMEHA